MMGVTVGILLPEKTFFSFCQNMSYQSDDLAVPAIRWLGVHPTDISRLGMKTQPLSAADFNKVRKLLSRSYITSHEALRDQVPLVQKFTYIAHDESILDLVIFLIER
jgi:DNA topoisomerase VI subunit A